MPLTFVTGPVRSGKSRFAERLARERGRPVLYVATAARHPDDLEWQARIAHHRATRPPEWAFLESAVPGAPELGAYVVAQPATRTVLVDSFGTWLAAYMNEDVDPRALEDRALAFARDLARASAHVIVVGEEVGWGIVPMAASARLFRDVAGRAQQRLAHDAIAAYLVVAGYAIDLTRAGRARRAISAERERFTERIVITSQYFTSGKSKSIGRRKHLRGAPGRLD